ncbi:putative bifunctional diguanylate cyclase/phosphodiesterase [Fundidesulfovibrio putealis]|uniref:putative bifunctional diguanylate cyclase/phosphodiesterase n=1 Tax=Fundidesulfovibrio putealis TaxID=270496 RepID=UPI0004067100|nr:EAL domain-containing protein [Fundidesulfovibrio putealis]
MNDLSLCSHDHEAVRLLEGLMDANPCGVVITAPDGRIERVNPAFTAITGYEPHEAVGQTPRILKSERHDKAFYTALWDELIELGHWEGEIWNRRKSGETYPERLTIQAVFSPEGRLEHYVAVFSDLSDVKLHKELLLHSAYHDGLTSLPNRDLFLDRLGMALRQARQDGQTLGVICLDLDRFKAVNESLGHVVGDIVLSEVGVRLTKLLRQADTLARLSGDAFAMLLTGLRDPQDAAHVAGRVLTSLAEPMSLQGQDLHIGASLGLTIAPTDGIDPAQLLQNAEIAMYRAKEEGRNNFQFFTEDLGERVSHNLRLENALRKALTREEFVLHYQPRVDVFTGEIKGMEALVRWQRPDGQLVGPGDFIALAEETGLIVPLGEWVLEEACRQTHFWTGQGLGEPKVSVNLSPRQLELPGFAARVLAILERTGLSPFQLEVEITENVFFKCFDTARTCLGDLAAAGITVALDDFGTGYSSLTYLKRLPIGTLKIDKSFVDGLPDDADDAGIVTAVVSIAATLGMQVVAEGVENFRQLEFLRSLNCCDGFQGYLFARPVPPMEFAALLRRGAYLLPEPERT